MVGIAVQYYWTGDIEMKRILIIANTYFQVIISIQMKNTIFKNSHVELLISDHSNGANKVCTKIMHMGIFDNCAFIESKNSDRDISFRQKMIDCIEMGIGKKNRYSKYLSNVSSDAFDEFVFYNEDYFEIDGIYADLGKRNRAVKFSMYEEGLLTYRIEISANKKRKFIEILKNLNNRPGLLNQQYTFYCFYPEIYNGIGIVKKVPLISRNCLTAYQLKQIFEPSMEKYKQKYIFFTSVYDFEGGEPIGEYELVSKVAELVGNDNLLVKTHPRDRRTIYIDHGYNVDENSMIPWEAIQLSGNFEDKIFLTINSCSVLSGSTMSERPVKTYYLYKLCDISGNPACKRNAEDIENLLDQKVLNNTLKMVRIANKLEEIL